MVANSHLMKKLQFTKNVPVIPATRVVALKECNNSNPSQILHKMSVSTTGSGTLSISSPEIGAIHWPTKTADLPPLKKPHLNLLRQALKVAGYINLRVCIKVWQQCPRERYKIRQIFGQNSTYFLRKLCFLNSKK